MNGVTARLAIVNCKFAPPYEQQLKDPQLTDDVTASQPQLVHSPSQQSLSASGHSSPDYASGASSVEQRNPASQYETPPSRPHSPVAAKPAESEMTLPSRPLAVHPAPLNVRRSQDPQARIPMAALYRQMHNLSPPTPGVDETPYIRFAIEQLTRDEELMGRARQGSISSLDYPIERIIPDEGLGYYTATATAPVTAPQSQVPPSSPKTSPNTPMSNVSDMRGPGKDSTHQSRR